MRLLKFILPITAMLMVFAVVESTAQICVFKEGEEYRLEDAIKYKGDNLEFIKFCCDCLRKCSPSYFVEDKYMLTHIAAKYNRTEVLEYLVKEKEIPFDKFPVDLKNGGYDKTYTPIMFAAKYNAYESSEYLIRIGASITRKNMYNEDALDLAKTTKNQKLISLFQSAWNKAKGYSYNQIEQEKAKLRNLLKPEAIQKHFAQNTVVQTTKPYIQSVEANRI